MNPRLPQTVLVRHGQTEWSLTGKHTGRADIPLTPDGQERARMLKSRLVEFINFPILCSPSQRAKMTCELAGFSAHCIIDPDLHEWDYGQYEGLTSSQIRQINPQWQLFRDGAPGGESVADISIRADRVLKKLRSSGDMILFSSGHFLRVLASRWLDLPADAGAKLALDTGTVSILSYEHDLTDPVLKRWNAV